MPAATAAQPPVTQPLSPEAQRDQLVAQTIRKITSIATLPEVTSRIIATVEDPNSTAQQLHKIVSHDPALVTRILKVVNSAFYGLPGQIGSIERAIVLLGLNAIKNIAVAASIGQLFRGVKLTEQYNVKDLWKHCIAVAVAARDLALQMKMPILDEVFLAGLIHDLGILVELHVWPTKIQQVCDKVGKSDNLDFCAVEREITGVDHQALGLALAELWKFPKSCQLVAGHHHEPQALADSSRVIVSLVHVADTICCQDGIGFPLTAKNQKLDATMLQSIGLDQSMIDRTRQALPQLVANAESVI